LAFVDCVGLKVSPASSEESSDVGGLSHFNDTGRVDVGEDE
jgi:hypothetical protein